MIRFLHSADWQIGAQRSIPGSAARQKQALDELIEHALREEVDALLVSGDVFEHGRPVQSEKDLVLSKLHRADREGLPVVMIPGNHDYEDKALSGYHALKTFQSIQDRFMGLVVIDQPTVIDMGDYIVAGVPPTALTETQLDPATWPDVGGTPALTLLKSGKPSVLLMHATIQGVVVPGLALTDGVPPDIVGRLPFTYIALGDIHVQQQVHFRSKRAPVAWYPGSLIQKNFGEKVEESGALVVEIDEGRVSVRPIRMEKPARLWTGSYTITKNSSYVDPRLADYIPSNAIAKVTVFGSPDHLREFDRRLDGVRKRLAEQGSDILVDAQLIESKADLPAPEEGGDELKTMLTAPPDEDLQAFIKGGRWPVDPKLLQEVAGGILGTQLKTQEQTGKPSVASFELHEVRGKNFLSLGDFSIPLKGQGLVCMLGMNRDTGGSNGSGKSSVLDVIPFALHGKMSRPGISHDKVINASTGEGWMELFERFRGIDGRLYETRVTRNHPDDGTLFRIEDLQFDGDDRDITRKGQPDDQVAELTGMTSDLFRGAACLGQNDAHTLVFGTNLSRQLFISEYFRLGIWRDCETEAAALQKSIGTRETELVARIETLEEIVEGAHNLDDPRDLYERSTTLEKNRDELDAVCSDLRNQRQSLDARIEEARVDLDRLDARRRQAEDTQRLREEIDRKREELGDLATRLGEYAEHPERLEDAARSAYQKHAEATAELRRLIEQQSILRDGDEAKCPICRRRLDDDMRRELLETVDSEIEVAEDEKSNADRRSRVADRLQQNLKRFDRLKIEIESTLIPEVIEDLTEEIDAAEERYDSLRTRRSTIEQEADEANRRFREVTSDLSRVRERLSLVESQGTKIAEQEAQLSQMRTELEGIRKRLDALKVAAVDVFPKFRVQKIRAILTALNVELNKSLGVLTHGKMSAFFVFRQTKKKDELELFVEDPVRGKVLVESCSGGEQKRVVVATMVALWKLSQALTAQSCNYVGMDEIFRDLDGVGQDSILRLLQEIRDEMRTIIITTNTPPHMLDTTVFDKIWIAVKERGITRLVTDQEEARALLSDPDHLMVA